MSNELPSTQTRLWARATDAADGLADHGGTLQVKQNTEAAVRADLQAAKDTEKAYQQAIQTESDALGERNAVNSNAKGFLALAKRQLADEAGHLPPKLWPDGTTEIPYDVDARLKILEAVADYLKDHPAAANADKNFTETRARQLLADLPARRKTLHDAVRRRVTAKDLRDKADAALRTRLSGLTGELGQLLPDDSTDYYWFGLVPPAGAERPAAMDAPVLHQVGPQAVAVGWPHASRAEKYRPFVQVIGVDPDFRALDLQRGEDLLLEGLPPTATVRVALTAHNAAGESPRGPAAELALV